MHRIFIKKWNQYIFSKRRIKFEEFSFFIGRFQILRINWTYIKKVFYSFLNSSIMGILTYTKFYSSRSFSFRESKATFSISKTLNPFSFLRLFWSNINMVSFILISTRLIHSFFLFLNSFNTLFCSMQSLSLYISHFFPIKIIQFFRGTLFVAIKKRYNNI